MNLANRLTLPIFRTVGEVADAASRECYVVGGYVRDLLLKRHSKDIDFVTVGSGIEIAAAVAKALGKGAHLNVFRTYGTAQVRHGDDELEFVGARRESYRADSRNPIVEDGTLDDDLARRDFTINAMAICVNAGRFGELVDRYDGITDLYERIIRTPLDPDITFSDDPLRMMRAIRFATQLGFDIYPTTLEAITRNASRISIITRERIMDELMKIMAADVPSRGWKLLADTGLLELIFPELAAMRGVDTVRGRAHKDNFLHTLEVLDKVAAVSDDVWLRWSALLHDIGKPATKRWDDAVGWTFHNHNFIGAKMVPRIFRRMRFPLNDKMRYVSRMVELHMRPIALVEDEVTDSAVRRLLNDAGEDIDDLMTLCRADITSKNAEKVRRHLANFEHVQQKMQELEERDHIRNFQPPVDGGEIMRIFGLAPSPVVGELKAAVKDAILDGVIPNSRPEALQLLFDRAAALGLTPVAAPDDKPAAETAESV
ncbi:CCA tRNA nucleotidyltransferase [uncultured Duncaniella sp.]|uniref:CCA tRNA nucleotidyltransferase n=1 Tax=uncultured Duncaniella sp. TaxID=2768039 RepID=UPI0026E04527|nr:HD domain-containing protein [uncultured Duncaniella sp.]